MWFPACVGENMREFAERFYKSKAWETCRLGYLSSVGGLCENCLKKGIYVPAEIVHHKEHVEPWNIENPEVTLAWSNLQALCRQCHGKEHSADEIRKSKRRYEIGEGGSVEIKVDP